MSKDAAFKDGLNVVNIAGIDCIYDTFTGRWFMPPTLGQNQMYETFIRSTNRLLSQPNESPKIQVLDLLYKVKHAVQNTYESGVEAEFAYTALHLALSRLQTAISIIHLNWGEEEKCQNQT